MKEYMKDLMYILIIAFVLGILTGTLLVWGYTQTSSNVLVNLTAPTNNVPYNETFNNASQSIWNETFTGNQNNTFWIEISKNSTVIDAKLNLSGYNNGTAGFSTTYAYLDVGGDGDKDWQYSGTIVTTDSSSIADEDVTYLTNLLNGNDSDWDTSTYHSCGGTPCNAIHVLENYSYDSRWVDPSTTNLSIMIETQSTSGNTLLYVWNYTSSAWKQIDGWGNTGLPGYGTHYDINTSDFVSLNQPLMIRTTVGSGLNSITEYYESEIFWTNNTFNVLNQQTSNLSSDINTYLSTCPANVNGTCSVPLVVHSNSAGKIQISAQNHTYNYNITSLLTSQYSSDTKILNQNYTHRTNVNFTNFNASNNMTLAGFYLNISGNNPVSCTVNGSSGTLDTTLKTCNSTISINKGSKFGNFTISYDKGIIFQPLTATNWTQNTSSTTSVNGTTYIKGQARGNNSDSINYMNVQYDNSVATQEARDSTWTCSSLTETDLNISAGSTGTASSYGIFCTKSSMIYVMEGTGWVQDTSFTTEAGNWTYIKGKYRANNSDASINYTNVQYDTSLNNTAVRSGWNGYISAGGYLNISAGQTNNSSSFNVYANKTGMITKLDAGDEILDSAFNSKRFANSSGWNYNTSWYYWISNISLNNTDETVNYTNVYWQNRLAGSDFNYSGNISNGTASTVNFNSLVNVETRYRTRSVNVTETEVKETATEYENDVNLYAPSDLDTNFRNSYYTSIFVNATLNSSYTSFDFFIWNGYAWEKHTSTSFYNFTVDANRSWATFYANVTASINYYSISSSAPVTVPPSETRGTGSSPKVIISGQNFTIEQPEFNLFGSPGGQIVTWITIKNLFSRMATPEFTCINGNYSIDFCKNVWFGEMEITEGKPQFKIYEIPAGTTSRIPIFLILPEEEGIWTDAFMIKVTLEGQEQLATATVSVSPFWGKVGEAINWFQGTTVFLNMRIPNSAIVLVSILIIIGLIILILKELKRYGRKK